MSEMAHLDSINGEPSPAPAQANIASHSTLASLPFDILRAIVWSERLDRNDVEHLRLTCRSLSGVAVTHLFYRISISKLNTDRDSFLCICRSPHLASHVRELEWLEITWDPDLFQRIPSNSSLPPGAFQLSEIEDDDTESIWRFTSRSGEKAYGRNPLVWFDEWDPEAGDQEEPTPFCQALLQFSRDGEETGFAPGGLKTYLGEGSQAWELINSLEPPEGAFNYGDCEDPTSNSHWKEHGDWPDWLESQP